VQESSSSNASGFNYMLNIIKIYNFTGWFT